jgi:hypothetical protein
MKYSLVMVVFLSAQQMVLCSPRAMRFNSISEGSEAARLPQRRLAGKPAEIALNVDAGDISASASGAAPHSLMR